MKINSVRIQNLRSIIDSKNIKLAKLTVLVGKNSVGKSTFLRSFPLIKQSELFQTAEPILWYTPELVDFGSFLTSKNKDSKGKNISFTYDFQFNYRILRLFDYYHRYSRDSESETAIPCKIKLSVNESGCSELNIDIFDWKIRINIVNQKNIVVSVNGLNLSNNFFTTTNYQAGQIFPNVILEEKLKPSSILKHRITRNNVVFNLMFEELKKISTDRISDETLFRFYDSLMANITSFTLFKKNFSTFTSKKKTFSSHFKQFDPDEQERYLQKLYNLCGYDYLYGVIEAINHEFAQYFAGVQYIAPIRATAERYYRMQALTVDEISPQGENVPTILWNMSKTAPTDYKNFQKWTQKQLHVYFDVSVFDGNISLMLIKNGKEINLADTGFGYSQMLPILVFLWKKDHRKTRTHFGEIIDSTLVIEQPELHLHPALQADLMHTFVELVNQNNNLNVIMETHSEYMIRQIGADIVNKTINKDDVNILIFQENNNQVDIKSSTFDDTGALNDWPIDFFQPTYFRE